jgi:ADP-dependent NAD(P)H-hydrate dehydratase / NAD(P)H-hydrate epimerase
MRICSVQEMRTLDRTAMTVYGLTDELLMENAGQSVYSVISRETAVPDHRFAVFSGPGNNGGDSFVVARKLHAAGGIVRVLVLGKALSYSGSARDNLQRIGKAGIETRFNPGTADIVESLAWCHIVVDGLLGTGIGRRLSGRFREVVDEVNRARKPVFSIDIPSGVDGDTGEARGLAIRATTTITFGLPKRGNILEPGGGMGGRLVLSPISFPPALIDQARLNVALSEPSNPRSVLRERDGGRDAKVVFILPGADSRHGPTLATSTFAAVRKRPATIVVPSLPNPALEESGPHSSRDVSPGAGTSARQDESGVVLPSTLGPDSFVALVGSAHDSRSATHRIARMVLSQVQAPLLMAPGVLTDETDLFHDLSRRAYPTVSILRVEDMARLVGRSVPEVRRTGIPLLQAWAHDHGVVAVLTGTTPLIAMPDQRVFIHAGRRPQEDVDRGEELLTGIIAAMYDLGLPLEDAVRTGVFLSSVVTDRAFTEGRAVDAKDLLREIPTAAEHFMRDFDGVKARHLRPVEVI